MSGSCNNICTRIQSFKKQNKPRYQDGEKRCQICCIYVKWSGVFCPCCSTRLRTHRLGSRFNTQEKQTRELYLIRH